MDNNNFNSSNDRYNPNNNSANGYNQDYNQSYNQNNEYNQNNNGSYNPNNEYNPNNNGSYNPYNEYNPNNNGNYHPDMNQYNPIPAPNQYRNCKTRNIIAVLLCALLGFVLFFDGILISIKVGVLSEKSFTKLIGDTDIIEDVRNDIISGIDKRFSTDIEGSFEDTVDEWLDYIINVIFDNKIPQKEEIRETLEDIYVDFFDVYVDEIINDIKRKDGIDTDELFTVSEFTSSMDKEAYSELENNMKSVFGNRIVLDASNQEEFKKLMLDFAAESKIISVSELTDEIYTALIEIQKELYNEAGDISINKIIVNIDNGIVSAIIGLSILAFICLVAVAVIDRQISVTLRGLFSSLFTPGIILLFLSLAAKGVIYMAVNALKSEAATAGNLVSGIADIIINPFIICSVVFMAVGILCRIIGTMTREKNDDKF